MELSIDYFYSLTPRQFYNIQTGYFNKVKRITNEAWLRSKVVSYFIYAGIPGKKSNKKKSFQEFEATFFKTDDRYKAKEPEVISVAERKKKILEFWERKDNQN